MDTALGGPFRSHAQPHNAAHRDGQPADATADLEAAMPVVERVSAHVQKIEQEVVALEKLRAEFAHAGADERAIGKAVYRAKVASNHLMNRMLELDGVTIVSAENRCVLLGP